jgi:pyruvate formate-lyase/glycerol dehydratase family glycyl radical enzyme
VHKRVKILKERTHVKTYPLCTEKARFITESCMKTDGEPQILKKAKAVANYLANRTIFIEDPELIVGNFASKPMGMEADCPTWPEDEMNELRNSGIDVSSEDEALLRSLETYWKGKGKNWYERIGLLLDDERLWPFMQSGIVLPPLRTKYEWFGYGAAGIGWGWNNMLLAVTDFAKVLNEGLEATITEAEEELTLLRYNDASSVKKGHYLQAVIIVHRAFIGIAKRFSELAEQMASNEQRTGRKKELQRIAETCRRVPGKPARSFYEALQSYWFVWMMVADGVAAGGRVDQFLYPFYKKDKKEGSITDDEVLELLECLRVKMMQLTFTSGSKAQREKWAGLARWNNWIIGGMTSDGQDATNELTYLILEAAMNCSTPHPTITVRVHEETPEALMIKALEVVKTGIGMPAFVGDKSYISYLLSQGVPLIDAREYALAGCLDLNLPGKSRINAIGMFVVPLVLEITMNNGKDLKTGRQLGPKTGEFETFESFDVLVKAFKTQLAYFMGLFSEYQNILLCAMADFTPDAFESSLTVEGIKAGKDALERTMPFENGSSFNPIGMITVVDSLAAIKKLIFDEHKVSRAELKKALAANWQSDGYADMRKMFLAAPKYGNGDDYVDSIARKLYQFWTDTIVTFTTAWGGTVKPSGVSITSHGPGGALVGATPDGRYAGELLSDGTMSAAQGRDTHGPTALLRSAMTINQIPFQSTLMNMKFHPSALKTAEDLKKLSDLMKIYFDAGGKHIQFNVVSRETLKKAQNHPDQHRDLIVRVAGYSAYFIQLTEAIQNDVMSRTEHRLAG